MKFIVKKNGELVREFDDAHEALDFVTDQFDCYESYATALDAEFIVMGADKESRDFLKRVSSEPKDTADIVAVDTGNPDEPISEIK